MDKELFEGRFALAGKHTKGKHIARYKLRKLDKERSIDHHIKNDSHNADRLF